MAKSEENKAKPDSKFNSKQENENTLKETETEQFNWGKLILQLAFAGVVIYFCWWIYKKIKKRVL